jgi:hypothetical protein
VLELANIFTLSSPAIVFLSLFADGIRRPSEAVVDRSGFSIAGLFTLGL